MSFRRDRSIREMYEERFHAERPGPYSRGGGGERRHHFGRSDEDYGRGYDYDSPRFFPNGGPRKYHSEDQRGYHGDSHQSFNNDARGGPPNRRDDYSYYRGPRDDPHSGRPTDYRGGSRAGPHSSARGQGSHPAPRSLSALGPDEGDDTLIQAVINLDRGEEKEGPRRKAPHSSVRDRSPIRRDVPPSPHSRSGSSISSRSYSPERSKSHQYQPPQGKSFEEPFGPRKSADRDRAPGPSANASRDGSPHSSVSASKEETPAIEVQPEEPVAPVEEFSTVMDDFHERRSQAIATKAREIEKVFRQDCETFGMVVKMLVAKDPSLEKHLQNPLKENLSEIRERCLEDLRHFISELDENPFICT
ncbi:periphilin-1 isoform X2 [Trichomycterus rosablanca]|uniref:periphilin-1 isoform X2 n=1 Tax=Trichomycterus rosablanca TaxID=2290929 RepID=UPI002F34F425